MTSDFKESSIPSLKTSNKTVEDMINKVKPFMFWNTLEFEKVSPKKVEDKKSSLDSKKKIPKMLYPKPSKITSDDNSKTLKDSEIPKRKGRPPVLDENGNRVHKKIYPKDDTTQCCAAKTATGKKCSSRAFSNGVCKTHSKFSFKFSEEDKQKEFVKDFSLLVSNLDSILDRVFKYKLKLTDLAHALNISDLDKDNPPYKIDKKIDDKISTFYETFCDLIDKYDRIIVINNIIIQYHSKTKDEKCECNYCFLLMD